MRRVLLRLLLCYVIGGHMTLGKVLGLSEDLCLAVDYGLSGGPQLEDPPYIIQIYPLGSHYFAGQRLNVLLTGILQHFNTFEGFSIQARQELEPGVLKEGPIGHFLSEKNMTKQICSSAFDGSGLTNVKMLIHPNGEQYLAVNLTWVAPDFDMGRIRFQATVIKDAKTYWVNVLSKPLICQNTDNVLGPRLAALETDFSIRQTCLTGCGRVKGCFTVPSGCDDNCWGILTWQVAGPNVNFEICGRSNGYVAVAFSDDKQMGRETVMQCYHNTLTNDVGFTQSWNTATPKNNVALNIQFPEDKLSAMIGIQSVEAARAKDGWLKCKVTRERNSRIAQLANLYAAYHIMVAIGETRSTGIIKHREKTVSDDRIALWPYSSAVSYKNNIGNPVVLAVMVVLATWGRL